MHEYFQANTEDQTTDNSAAMNNEAMNNESMNNESMNNEAMNNEAMNNNSVPMEPEDSMNNNSVPVNTSTRTDEQLSCQAALQTAMDKCVSEPVTSESLEDTVSETVLSGDPVIEGFKNPTQLWQPNVKLLLNVLIMMCVFYLLSHFETGKYLSSVVKGLKGRNLHLLLTLLFGLVYLILNKYL